MKRDKYYIPIIFVSIISIFMLGVINALPDDLKEFYGDNYKAEKSITEGLKKEEVSNSENNLNDEDVDDNNSMNSNSKDNNSKNGDSKDNNSKNSKSKDIESKEGDSEESSSDEGNEKSYTVDPNKPMIALTFDDGPKSGVTDRILDDLEENGGRVTFFVIGRYIDEGNNRDLIARASSLGCEIGNHTFDHVELSKLPEDQQIIDQVRATREKIVEITGQDTVILRPPYGSVDERCMNLINDPIVLWSVDTDDWMYRDPPRLLAYIMENAYDGAIPAMKLLREQGYQLVTVSDMIEARRGEYKHGVKYGEVTP